MGNTSFGEFYIPPQWVIGIKKCMTARSKMAGLLERLLSLPTAPFHERFVSSFLCDELKEAGIDFHQDRYGNIVAGGGDKKNSMAYVAHMDHPGFEIARVKGNRVEADWFGGVDAKYFIGARVVIYDQFTGAVGARGGGEKVSKNPQGRVEKMTLRIKGSAARGGFGTWDLVPFRRRAGFYRPPGDDSERFFPRLHQDHFR